MDQKSLAEMITETETALATYRALRRRPVLCRPAVGHMPFIGHRTVAHLRKLSARSKPADFGYDPSSIYGTAK